MCALRSRYNIFDPSTSCRWCCFLLALENEVNDSISKKFSDDELIDFKINRYVEVYGTTMEHKGRDNVLCRPYIYKWGATWSQRFSFGNISTHVASSVTSLVLFSSLGKASSRRNISWSSSSMTFTIHYPLYSSSSLSWSNLSRPGFTPKFYLPR